MERKVLDNGYVVLINMMGDDFTPALVAGISFNRHELRTPEQEERLIRHLLANQHDSVFEHIVFTFKVKAPLFVARQWMRHRIGSFNEVSLRYTKAKPEFYVPEADEQLRAKLLEGYMHAYNTYLELTESGMKKEQARTVLPLGLYTTFFWTVNLRSLFNFLELRTSEHAQYEMREYALAVRSIVCEKLPVICRHKFVEVEK